MTPAEDLLDDLRAVGFALWLEGGRLWVNPAPGLTDAQRQAVQKHRAGLIALLLDEAARLAPVLAGWDGPPADRVLLPGEPVPVAPVDADLAAWFRSARDSGLLPLAPFELAPAVVAGNPEGLYAWVEGRLATPQTAANRAECECTIRSIRRFVSWRAEP